MREIVERNVYHETTSYSSHSTNTSANETSFFPAHSSNLMHALRKCAGEMYDAAFSYAMRASACRQLEHLTLDQARTTLLPTPAPPLLPAEKKSTSSNITILETISHSDSYDSISFRMSVQSTKVKKTKGKHKSNKTLSVQLRYDNQLLCTPTKVKLLWSKGSMLLTSFTMTHETCAHDDNDENEESMNLNDPQIKNVKEKLKDIAALFRVFDIVGATKRSMKVIQKVSEA